MAGRYGEAPCGATTVDLPRTGRRAGGKIEIVHGFAPDPNEAAIGIAKGQIGRRQQRVAINANTDCLEREHAHGRITLAAYEAARTYQLVAERAAGARTGGSSMEPSNCVTDHDHAIAARLEAARRALEIREEVRVAIGNDGEALLQLVLGDGRTFQQIGQTCWRARIFAAQFRKALEALARHWERYGATN